MNFNSMTDQAVAKTLGERLSQLRLEKNLTQQDVADEVGLSRVSYGRLENGSAKLTNFIAVLRVLGQLDMLQQALPAVPFSPMEQLKLEGQRRQRASGTRAEQDNGSTEQQDKLDW